jgi:energy-coupling factor transport system ATP-binding protein
MVFQNPDNQLVATIVDEDVAFGLENIGVPHDEIVERVDLALCQVGMSEYKTSAPHNLSGGQKQRIAIAGVLAMRPTCIVFDEPTSMLDPQGRKDVIDTIVSLSREQGITVVLITHFMEEAVLADRVVVMNNGKIELDGTPEYVFSEVDLLKSIGLEVPASKELLYMLKNKGVDIDISALNEEKCVEIITEYLRRENNE